MIFFKKNGGGAVVENGSIGVRASEQHKYLEKLSKETNIHIILGTGKFRFHELSFLIIMQILAGT